MTEEWPKAAFSLLDSLWSTTTMSVIRKRMFERFGFYPMAAEVRAAANRFKETPVPKPAVTTNPGIEPESVPAFAWRDPAPERPKDNPVRLVKPGTFKAVGYTMLGKRT
jgi:hypothetical protein